jgi:hypothetical protein
LYDLLTFVNEDVEGFRFGIFALGLLELLQLCEQQITISSAQCRLLLRPDLRTEAAASAAAEPPAADIALRDRVH